MITSIKIQKIQFVKKKNQLSNEAHTYSKKSLSSHIF